MLVNIDEWYNNDLGIVLMIYDRTKIVAICTDLELFAYISISILNKSNKKHVNKKYPMSLNQGDTH